MSENKYLKMTERKQWKKLRKIAEGKHVDEVVEVAEACGTCKCEEAYNILVDMLSHSERPAKLAAIKGLGHLRYDVGSQKTKLLWILERAPEDDKELRDLIGESLAEIRSVKEA